jgi:hypothetical protein
MPYANPTPLFVDFLHPTGGFTVDQTYGLDRPGDLIPGMEMVWDYDQFPDDLSGRCLLLKLGLTFSIIDFSDEKAGIRFVITAEVTGPAGRTTQREAQIARGDAWATPGKGGSFGLSQYYGPIEPLRSGQLLILRARAAMLGKNPTKISEGALGTNELRAEVFRID